jgi:hypothetical protein
VLVVDLNPALERCLQFNESFFAVNLDSIFHHCLLVPNDAAGSPKNAAFSVRETLQKPFFFNTVSVTILRF